MRGGDHTYTTSIDQVHEMKIDAETWERATGAKLLSDGGKSKANLAAVVVIPVVLFILGAAGRIYYLHVSARPSPHAHRSKCLPELLSASFPKITHHVLPSPPLDTLP